MEWILVPAGFAVGVLVGLTGVGGGALMTPVLLLHGIAPAVAVGTDLVYAAITKSAAVAWHQRAGSIRWPVVARLALGSAPAALATVWWLGGMDGDGPGRSAVIVGILGAALVLTALVILLRPWLARLSGAQVVPWRGAATVAGGALLGVLVPASSVGAGAVGAALLLVLYRELPVTAVVGTDLAHAVLLAAISGAGHWRMGTVDLTLVPPLLLGSLPGIHLGTRLGGIVPDHVLRPIVAVVLLCLAVGLSFGAIT